MIIAAHRLLRDRSSESGYFGYERNLWTDQKYTPHRTTPMLGCPLMVETRLNHKLVKLVELYTYDEIMVIERLAWMFDDQIYPYRMRYIRPSHSSFSGDIPILFLSNMSAIYRKLSGVDVLFNSPLQFYLHNAIYGQFTSDPRNDTIADICQRYRTSLESMAYQDVDQKSLKDFLPMLDVEYTSANIAECMRKNVLPKLLVPDMISGKTMRKPLSARHVVMSIDRNNPYDTSPVAPLQINHPDVTLYSPKKYHDVARMLDDISGVYTDVKLEYILSEDAIVGCTVHHLISRYLDDPDEAIVSHLCNWVVVQIMCGYEHSQHDRRQGVIVMLELTYGEEALVEIYTLDRTICLYAVHFDLAMIALCASGVLAFSP